MEPRYVVAAAKVEISICTNPHLIYLATTKLSWRLFIVMGHAGGVLQFLEAWLSWKDAGNKHVSKADGATEEARARPILPVQPTKHATDEEAEPNGKLIKQIQIMITASAQKLEARFKGLEARFESKFDKLEGKVDKLAVELAGVKEDVADMRVRILDIEDTFEAHDVPVLRRRNLATGPIRHN